MTQFRKNRITYPLLSIARHRMGTDGTGVTTLVAGAGCPLHCKWCINRQLLQDAPSKETTPQELLDLVMIDDLYFRASGGGITFGGGESLLHADFIREFRNICPSQWKINAETSLYVPRNYLAAITDCVDLFIVDCKDMNAEIYAEYTGGDCAVMEENLKFLLERVGPEKVIVRVPLIPEYNTKADQENSAEKLKKIGVTGLDLFEYVIRERLSESPSEMGKMK